MCKLPCPSLYEMNKVLLFGFAVIIDGKAGSDGLAPFTERGGAIGTLADDCVIDQQSLGGCVNTPFCSTSVVFADDWFSLLICVAVAVFLKLALFINAELHQTVCNLCHVGELSEIKSDMTAAATIGQDIAEFKLLKACPLVVTFDGCRCLGGFPVVGVRLLIQRTGGVRNLYTVCGPVVRGWNTFLSFMNTDVFTDGFDAGNRAFLGGNRF